MEFMVSCGLQAKNQQAGTSVCTIQHRWWIKRHIAELLSQFFLSSTLEFSPGTLLNTVTPSTMMAWCLSTPPFRSSKGSGLKSWPKLNRNLKNLEGHSNTKQWRDNLWWLVRQASNTSRISGLPSRLTWMNKCTRATPATIEYNWYKYQKPNLYDHLLARALQHTWSNNLQSKRATFIEQQTIEEHSKKPANQVATHAKRIYCKRFKFSRSGPGLSCWNWPEPAHLCGRLRNLPLGRCQIK